MGSLRRKTFTKPLPEGAETIHRKGKLLARWKAGKGKTRTAPIATNEDGTPRLAADGLMRIVLTSRKWLAKYRDGNGLLIEVPTGCTDRQAAEQVLRDFERTAERIRCGIATDAESRTVATAQTDIAGHFAAFRDHRQARGRCSRPKELLSQLERVAADCRFSKLCEVDGAAFERWLSERAADGMGAGTRNKYRTLWLAFCNWAVRSGRMLTNPLATVAKADERTDRRRTRRALTAEELRRLLDVARRRPLLDMQTVRRGRDAGRPLCNLRPKTVARLERLGRERALIYKTLALTGLRRNELRTLTVGQLDLDHEPAFLTLDAGDTKNREAATIPLRSDLAADLRDWLADKAKARCQERQDAATTPGVLTPEHGRPTPGGNSGTARRTYRPTLWFSLYRPGLCESSTGT